MLDYLCDSGPPVQPDEPAQQSNEQQALSSARRGVGGADTPLVAGGLGPLGAPLNTGLGPLNGAGTPSGALSPVGSEGNSPITSETGSVGAELVSGDKLALSIDAEVL